jgi:hypothetical protein
MHRRRFAVKPSNYYYVLFFILGLIKVLFPESAFADNCYARLMGGDLSMDDCSSTVWDQMAPLVSSIGVISLIVAKKPGSWGDWKDDSWDESNSDDDEDKDPGQWGDWIDEDGESNMYGQEGSSDGEMPSSKNADTSGGNALKTAEGKPDATKPRPPKPALPPLGGDDLPPSSNTTIN